MKAKNSIIGGLGRIGLVAFAIVAALGALVAPGGRSVSAATFSAGDRVQVIDGRLNLREAPGLSADVVEVLEDGTGLDLIAGPSGASGLSWYKVATDDDVTGWVAGNYLALAGSGRAFGSGDTVRVVDGALNLREEPGLDGAVLRVIEDGTAASVTDGPVAADGYTWYEIFNFGFGHGWVAGEFLVADSGVSMCEGQGPCEDPQTAGDTVRVVTDVLNLRAEPGFGGAVLDVLPNGTVGEYTGEIDGADGLAWVEITGDFGTGWVARQYVAFE